MQADDCCLPVCPPALPDPTLAERLAPPFSNMQLAAQQHFMRQQLGRWRQAAAESRQERVDALRGAVSDDARLLRRGWRAWRLAVQQERQGARALALAEQHCHGRLLASCWASWQEWTLVCRGMAQRRAARLLAAALAAWRSAAKLAEKR